VDIRPNAIMHRIDQVPVPEGTKPEAVGGRSRRPGLGVLPADALVSWRTGGWATCFGAVQKTRAGLDYRPRAKHKGLDCAEPMSRPMGYSGGPSEGPVILPLRAVFA
jgi:hypothetical protein